jgi:RNase H-like domain found in reverse transcriptase/Reverse transcriptase (RNA-dependent DNA polymerase)
LKAAYNQLALHVDSRDLTGFIMHIGVFRHKRVPFGLSSAPSAFQKIVADLIKGVKGACNLLDDIVVHAPTLLQHDKYLRAVLKQLAEHNLTLNVGKCVLGVMSLRVIGHEISADSAKLLCDNVQAMKRIADPENKTQLVSLLRSLSYYSRFVMNFAHLTHELRRKTHDNVEWQWTNADSQRLQQILQHLTSPPVLAHFDVNAPRTVAARDSSSIALGASLLQTDSDGVERPIANASRMLNDNEQRCSVGEKEALACL